MNNKKEPKKENKKEKISSQKEWKTEKKRLLAEIDNLRKVYAKRNLENMIYSQQKLFTDFLEICNSFEIALNFRPKEKETKQFMKGMVIGIENFFHTLSKHGFRKIDAKVGDIQNCEFHEEVDFRFEKNKKPDVILEITQSGYLFNDRVLQTTKVVVNKKEKSAKKGEKI